jgi:hypothetical protein
MFPVIFIDGNYFKFSDFFNIVKIFMIYGIIYPYSNSFRDNLMITMVTKIYDAFIREDSKLIRENIRNDIGGLGDEVITLKTNSEMIEKMMWAIIASMIALVLKAYFLPN